MTMKYETTSTGTNIAANVATLRQRKSITFDDYVRVKKTEIRTTPHRVGVIMSVRFSTIVTSCIHRSSLVNVDLMTMTRRSNQSFVPSRAERHTPVVWYVSYVTREPATKMAFSISPLRLCCLSIGCVRFVRFVCSKSVRVTAPLSRARYLYIVACFDRCFRSFVSLAPLFPSLSLSLHSKTERELTTVRSTYRVARLSRNRPTDLNVDERLSRRRARPKH